MPMLKPSRSLSTWPGSGLSHFKFAEYESARPYCSRRLACQNKMTASSPVTQDSGDPIDAGSIVTGDAAAKDTSDGSFSDLGADRGVSDERSGDTAGGDAAGGVTASSGPPSGRIHPKQQAELTEHLISALF